MEPGRGGDRAARHAAQQGPARRLRRAAPPQGRAAAAGAGVRSRRLPARMPRRQTRRRRDAALLRRGSRALARRPLVGARRSHAGALGRGLRAREPHHHLARFPAALSRPQGAAPRAVLRHRARQPGALGAGAGRENERLSLHGAADAGAAQRDLFRAHLSRALPRPRAGRGQRPDGARWLRVAEDAFGTAAGTRDPAPPG